MRLSVIRILCVLAVAVGLWSCQHDSPLPTPPDPQTGVRTVLVYAVASNNLYGDYADDQAEMLRGLQEVYDLDAYRLLVYRVLPLSFNNPATLQPYDVQLLEAYRKSDGNAGLRALKTYDRAVYSTDPARLAEVVADMQHYAPAAAYGLVLWSHGAGWLPASVSAARPREREGAFYSFGIDQGQTGTDYMDIDELADALPDGLFDFIWFDACYMGGIEVAYQLRHKCEAFVSYPTEVLAEGIPYHLVMPWLMRENAWVTTAATKVFEYFNKAGRSVTISVCRTDRLEELAEATAAIYAGTTADLTNADGLQYYSRSLTNPSAAAPFYDFGQYVMRLAEPMPEAYGQRFAEALEECVIYKGVSDYSFAGRPFDKEVYSGLSTHVMRNAGTREDNYYMTLDWARRVAGCRD